MIKYFTVFLLVATYTASSAQSRSAIYYPCLLQDSIDKRLDFIRQNASRIFTDTASCKETLLDSIASKYIEAKEVKYLEALSSIRQNPSVKVEELYIDIIKRIIEKDFTGFVDKLYRAAGRFSPLQNELIATMNMIVDGRPLKQKYIGVLNVEIAKTKSKKDKSKQYYLEKLKGEIENEKYKK